MARRDVGAMLNIFNQMFSQYMGGLEGEGFQNLLKSLYESQEPLLMEGMEKFGHQAAGFGQAVPGQGFSGAARAGERDLMSKFMADITGSALQTYTMPYGGLFGATGNIPGYLMKGREQDLMLKMEKGKGLMYGPEMTGGGGGMCCFIFIEADDGKLDSIARRFRDESGTPKARSGYRRLANWLVPKMRESKAVKNLVRFFMVKPMIGAGGFAYRQNHWGHIFVPLAIAWIMVFELLGMRRDYDFVHSTSA